MNSLDGIYIADHIDLVMQTTQNVLLPLQREFEGRDSQWIAQE